MSAASLAETLYYAYGEAFGLQPNGTVWPSFDAIDPAMRAAWESVALEACRSISSDLAVIADGYPADNLATAGVRHAIALIGVHDVHAHAEDRLLAVRRATTGAALADIASLQPGELAALMLDTRCMDCGHLAALHYADSRPADGCEVDGCACKGGRYDHTRRS